MFYPNKCAGCGRCLKICPNGCHTKNNGHTFSRELCAVCGNCASGCGFGALAQAGRYYSVPEVLEIISADIAFYERSKGGLTCSGGEPLLQHEFAIELLAEARRLGINTAVDTAGDVDYGIFERVTAKTDLFLFDLKCMDEKKHIKATGAGNRRILENLKRLGMGEVPVWVRIPVIPGFNDDLENIKKTAEFLKGLTGVKKVELLAYHNLGENKYKSLGMEIKTKDLKAPAANTIKKLSGIFDNINNINNVNNI